MCLLLLLHISIDFLSAQIVVLTSFYSFTLLFRYLCYLCLLLTGNRCLLFSNDGPDVISKLFDANQVEDYARSGADAVSTVTLPQGPLPTMIHSMVDPLRKLGLQVTLNKGVVTLDADTDLCVKGTLLVNSKETFVLLLFMFSQITMLTFCDFQFFSFFYSLYYFDVFYYFSNSYRQSLSNIETQVLKFHQSKQNY